MGQEEFLNLALSKKFDLLIYVELTDFLTAFGSETARAAVSLKVYDVKTKVTLWYIDGAQYESGKDQKDYILWKTKGKDPPSPRYILKQIAEATAKMMVKEI